MGKGLNHPLLNFTALEVVFLFKFLNFCFFCLDLFKKSIFYFYSFCFLFILSSVRNLLGKKPQKDIGIGIELGAICNALVGYNAILMCCVLSSIIGRYLFYS